MRAKSFEGMACSIAMVLDAGRPLGHAGPAGSGAALRRYDDLRRSTGITNATLADRLKLLEQNGLIERSLYQSAPERYEYLPTAKGLDVALVLQALVQVGDKWRAQESGGAAAASSARRPAGACGWMGTRARRCPTRIRPPGADDLIGALARRKE